MLKVYFFINLRDLNDKCADYDQEVKILWNVFRFILSYFGWDNKCFKIKNSFIFVFS